MTDLITNPPHLDPYTALKERLLIAHQLSPIQQAAKILSMLVIGDRQLSQLLADLMEYCPPGEENTAFFRAAYKQRLPAEMQVLLDGVEDGDLKQLVQKADKLWAIRRPANSNLASIVGVAAEECVWTSFGTAWLSTGPRGSPGGDSPSGNCSSPAVVCRGGKG